MANILLGGWDGRGRRRIFKVNSVQEGCVLAQRNRHHNSED